MPWKTLSTQTEIIAIHAALLPTKAKGEVLCFGDWTNPSASTHTRIYTIDPEAISGFPMADLPNTNAFCGGQSFLADGRLLVGGGTIDWPQLAADQAIPPGGNPHAHHYHGDRACWTYLPIARKWQRVKDLNFQPGSDSVGGGRWYPTLVTLGNGEVFAAGGHPDIGDTFEGRHNNTTPERYQTALNKWVLLTAERTSTSGVTNDSYPRYHLLPDGRLFSDTTGNASQKQIYDPYTGQWVGANVQFTNWDGFYDYGSAGTSVLLPLLPPNYPVRILATNGAKSYRLDLAAMKWENTAARVGSAAGKIRNNCCAVILPTGKVFMSGGVQDPVAPNAPVIPVLQPELYDPGLNFTAGDFSGAEQWINLPAGDAATVPRGYHSVALLLPDGRVWTAGSTEGSLGTTENAEKRVEVYEPDYFANAGRPEITSVVGNVSYNQSFVIATPQAASIKRVALIRCGSITHGFDSDQRYVGLGFQKGEGNTLVATAPPNGNLAPPGYYMLWLVDSQERPCKLAKFIRVSAQKCDIALDISTYSKVEAQAAGSPALFSKAIYVIYDGFLPGEIDTPTITLRRPDNSAPPGMIAQLQSVSYEAGQGAADVAQRIVFCYDIIFNNTQSFDQIPAAEAFQTVTFRADMRHFSCQVPLTLSKNPNPFMRDGDPPWLSVDVRVFKISAGETPALAAGVPQDSGSVFGLGTAPFDFIQGLLAKYNQLAGQPNHPFDGIDPSQPGSRLALYSHDSNGERVFNYAVARVRYRAPVGIDAAQVKLFFRLCTTGWSGLDYSTNLSYRRAGNGPTAAPLLGLVGGAINTIPCFAEPRVDFMPAQTDPLNVRTLKGAGNSEVHNYFGCWLDINDDVERFPEEPQNDGPFIALSVLQQPANGGRVDARPASMSGRGNSLHAGSDRQRCNLRHVRQSIPTQHSARSFRQPWRRRNAFGAAHLRAQADGHSCRRADDAAAGGGQHARGRHRPRRSRRTHDRVGQSAARRPCDVVLQQCRCQQRAAARQLAQRAGQLEQPSRKHGAMPGDRCLVRSDPVVHQSDSSVAHPAIAAERRDRSALQDRCAADSAAHAAHHRDVPIRCARDDRRHDRSRVTSQLRGAQAHRNEDCDRQSLVRHLAALPRAMC